MSLEGQEIWYFWELCALRALNVDDSSVLCPALHRPLEVHAGLSFALAWNKTAEGLSPAGTCRCALPQVCFWGVFEATLCTSWPLSRTNSSRPEESSQHYVNYYNIHVPVCHIICMLMCICTTTLLKVATFKHRRDQTSKLPWETSVEFVFFCCFYVCGVRAVFTLQNFTWENVPDGAG